MTLYLYKYKYVIIVIGNLCVCICFGCRIHNTLVSWTSHNCSYHFNLDSNQISSILRQF